MSQTDTDAHAENQQVEALKTYERKQRATHTMPLRDPGSRRYK